MSRILLILLTVLIALLASVAHAAPDLRGIAERTPGAGEFPGADQITLYEHIEIAVDADGRATRRVHRIRKLLTNWAMRRVADPRVGWDSSRQTLEVEVCRTLQPGGAIVESPANALNEVTPDAVGRCAEFLDLREMVISHVGLEPGCVVELVYTVRDLEPGVLPPSGRIFLQDRWPVLERSVALSGPDLRWEVVHGEAEVGHDDGGPTVTVRNVAGLPGDGAHRDDHVPYLAYAYGVEDWAALAGGVAVAGDAARTLNDDMRTWLRSGDDLTTTDTIQRIAALVGDETRTVHLPGGMFSRAPRTAAEVFDSGCASRWEEALLASTLLAGLDLDPSLVLIDRHVPPSAKACAVQEWDRMLVAVEHDGQRWWISPDRDEAWAGPALDGPTTELVVFGPDPGRIVAPNPDPETATSEMIVSIAPDAEVMAMTIDWRATGLLRGSVMDADQLAETLAHAVLPGADVRGLEVLKLDRRDAHLRVEAQVDDLGEFDDGVLVLDLPHVPDGALTRLPADCHLYEPERQAPLYLPGAMTQSLSLRFELPEGVTIDHLPSAVDAEAGASSYRLTVDQADGVIEMDCRLRLDGAPTAPADWPALRGLLLGVRNDAAGSIVLIEP